jgi:hypothetical protein
LNWVLAISVSFCCGRLTGVSGLDVCGGVLLVAEGRGSWLGVRVGIAVGLGDGPERLVHLQQRLLLPLGEHRVAQDRELDRAHLVVVRVEDAGLHVDLLGGDPQRLGQRLEHLCRRPAKTAFDLAQVGVGNPGLLRELPQGQLGTDPLLPQVDPERLDGHPDLGLLGHISILLTFASTCNPMAGDDCHKPLRYAGFQLPHVLAEEPILGCGDASLR